MSKILVALAIVFGYLTYTAADMGEKGIALGMGIVMVLCAWGALSGGKKTSGSAAASAKTSRRG